MEDIGSVVCLPSLLRNPQFHMYFINLYTLQHNDVLLLFLSCNAYIYMYVYLLLGLITNNLLLNNLIFVLSMVTKIVFIRCGVFLFV